MIGIGIGVHSAMDAANLLAGTGIETTVINARFAKPLDSALITDVARHIKRIVTIEENTLIGGFGSSVVTLLEESGISGFRSHCVGIPDRFVEQGTQAILREKYGLDPSGIVKQVLEVFPELSGRKLPTLRP